MGNLRFSTASDARCRVSDRMRIQSARRMGIPDSNRAENQHSTPSGRRRSLLVSPVLTGCTELLRGTGSWRAPPRMLSQISSQLGRMSAPEGRDVGQEDRLLRFSKYRL